MSKRNSLIVVDAKMYKHFAIVTVALTGGIALLADGEKREAVAQSVEEIKTYEPEKVELVIKNDQVKRGGGNLSGFYGSGGDNVGGSNSGGDSSYIPAALGGMPGSSNIDTQSLAELGLSLADFRALDPDEQAEVRDQLGNGQSEADRQKAIRQASAASLARSGGGEGTDY